MVDNWNAKVVVGRSTMTGTKDLRQAEFHRVCATDGKCVGIGLELSICPCLLEAMDRAIDATNCVGGYGAGFRTAQAFENDADASDEALP